MEYTELKLSSTSMFSVKALTDSVRQLEWLRYEVAPEWQRFCSFGPEDIGSVWEQIGAIRKRPRMATVMLPEAMIASMNRAIERECLYGSARHDALLFGVRVLGTPLCSPNVGYLIKGDSV
jgi:hypothetical protein